MIAQWMLYGLVVALCFGFAAAAGEALLRLNGHSGRWVWGAALVSSIGLPLFNLRFPELLARSVVHPALDSGARIVIGTLVPVGTGMSAVSDSNGVFIDRLLLVMWVVLSVVFLYVVVWTSLKLLRERRGWHKALVGGRSVLVSSDVGPAVVGFRQPEIVVPNWVLDLDESEQRLVVMHEEEHARAGDLRLLVSGLAAAVLLPWNPAIWWQMRRLRLAVEADCDARVLKHGTSAHSYGAFLMNICGRAQRPRVAALALSERRSPLARRIEMMVPETRGRLGRLALSMIVCFSALTLACEFPIPFATDEQRVFAEYEVDEPPELVTRPRFEYPQDLLDEGAEGVVRVQGVVGLDGKIEAESASIVESTDERFNEATLDYLNQLTFLPGRMDGEPVRVLIGMPIQYSLIGGN